MRKKTPYATQVTTFRLPKTLHVKLKKVARRRGITLTALVANTLAKVR